uniref:Peptidase S1 domain-containing protein n=1 Tax=Panagrolaimus sp. PS1159 TaxID=55785 RepID=A0AC35FLE6_9BILA
KFLGDFLELSKLSKEENDELQKICGKTDFKNQNFKVSLGAQAFPGQFPWVIALGEGSAYCSGTIISSRHIITAAHCISDYESKQVPCGGPRIVTDPSKLKISYGGVCLRSNENLCPNGRDMKIGKVRKIMLPQHFNDMLCDSGADLAIIELEEDLIFNERTKPICIGYFKTDGRLYDLGFGRDENDNQVPNLRFIEVNYNKNAPRYGNILTRPKYPLPFGVKQPGMCNGDSGGPFQINIGSPIRSFLHGVHSFGGKCATSSRDHSNTNILFYIEWICERTGICRKWKETEIEKNVINM